MIKRIFIILTTASFILLSAIFLKAVDAQTRSSANYRIQQDSINMGGTENSTSSSYQISDSLGELGTGISTSASYNLYAGYRQMDTTYISISEVGAVNLLPNIGGVSGGTANGSTTFTVITDSPSGYSVGLKAASDPALKSISYSFANYTADSNPDYTWSIAATSSEFGFSPEGSDIVQKFKDDGNACNAGSSDTPDKCWYGLSVSDENIANSNLSNHPLGAQTTIKFQAESGSSHIQEAGDYLSVITLTVTSN